MVGRSISHYEITEKLGEGGMGVVYKARETHLDRFVAIKVLPPEKVDDPERKRRFVQEANAASARGQLQAQGGRNRMQTTMGGFHIAIAAVLLVSATLVAQVSPKARAIHDSAIVVDTHADTPVRFLDGGFDVASTDPKDHGHISLDKARAGNLAAVFFSIWDAPRFNQGNFARKAFDLIDSVYEQVALNSTRMTMALSADDIERARKDKKLAALMGLEGGHSIEGDIRLLRIFYRLGVRYMTLTWSNTNEWADSSGDQNDPKVKHHNGLTDFGRQVVLEMNRLGMMVDVSHVSEKTFWDVIAVTRAPVIASHDCASALVSSPRNVTDDMVRAVAKSGGVVHVNFYSALLDERFSKAVAEQEKERAAAVEQHLGKLQAEGRAVNSFDVDYVWREWLAKIPRPPLSSLVDHIDHIAKVAGVDHVGVGSDFDGVSGATPEGIDSAADLPKITQALLDRGYSSADIHKILGGNLLRVFREVERVSRKMRAGVLPLAAPGRSAAKNTE